MHDIDCPYCGTGVDICHDDGYGYDEGEAHEQDCPHCERTFVYRTTIHFHYDAIEAPCKNGDPHQFKPFTRHGWPQPVEMLRCKVCDHEEPAEKEG